jgi:hypothetical protein
MDATGQLRQHRVKKWLNCLSLMLITSKLTGRTRYGVLRKPATIEMCNTELYNPIACQFLILFLFSVCLTKAKFVHSVVVE